MSRQADEKALDLPARSRFGEGRAEPFSDWIQKLKYCEKITFHAPRTLADKLNDAPRSKALESVWLLLSHFRTITTWSPRERIKLSLSKVKVAKEAVVFHYDK